MEDIAAKERTWSWKRHSRRESRIWDMMSRPDESRSTSTQGNIRDSVDLSHTSRDLPLFIRLPNLVG